jgi:hypothetical protein
VSTWSRARRDQTKSRQKAAKEANKSNARKTQTANQAAKQTKNQTKAVEAQKNRIRKHRRETQADANPVFCLIAS